MAFSSIAAKIIFTGFNTTQKDQLLGALQTAYDGSTTAQTMFDQWINAGKTISISNVPGVFQAFAGTGKVEIDLGYIKNLSYISDTGTPVLHSLLGALVHELGHALNSNRDNVSLTDYQGDNVRFVNKIWRELGLPQEISYLAQARSDIHRVGYQYTNGAAIDAARSGNFNMNSSALGVSNDLLIGGASNNILRSGSGNDFLFGGGGDDQLDGGEGRDTAVYFGSALDYDIRQNADGSWAVHHVRGARDAGLDTLKNIEVLQFDDGNTYDLIEDAKSEKMLLTGSTAANLSETNQSIRGNNLANNIGRKLFGLAGNDILTGGIGNDILDGGNGDDILRGNGGANTFVLNAPRSGVDIIQDFVRNQDKLQISANSFRGGLRPEVALNSNQLLIGSGTINATNTEQRFIYNTDNGKLYFDVDGSGRSEKVQIAVLSNFSNLNVNSFVIV